jgi:hypothetical protein
MIRAGALRPSGHASVQDLGGNTARDLAPLQRGPNAPPLLFKTQTLHSQARPCLRVYYNAKILARRSSLLERWLAEELTFSARAQKTCQLNQTEVDSVALPLGLHVFL